ncbi:MAG: hypothetical protein ABH854_02730 [Candidatus Diapherotrites archaeon]
MRIGLFVASVILLLIFGCVGQVTKYAAVPQEDARSVLSKGQDVMESAMKGEADPENICVGLCRAELEKGTDLSGGPCLGNPIVGYVDWVCDVAHSPREDVDNLPGNQCSAFRQGIAKHFVEVGENCGVIKIN